MSIITWNKGEDFQLSPHFSSSEFNCSCNLKSCVEQQIDLDLILKLSQLRSVMDEPIRVHSGFRCEEYQKILTSKGHQTSKNSQHCLGRAADISSSGLDRLYNASEIFFDAIGDGRKKGFIHVDLRAEKMRRWDYV